MDSRISITTAAIAALAAGAGAAIVLASFPKRRSHRRRYLDEEEEDDDNLETTIHRKTTRSIRRNRRRVDETQTEEDEKEKWGESIILQDHVSGWEGFSMEDAMKHSQAAAKKAQARTPKQVLSQLQKGNARFWMGVSRRPEASAFERRALIMQQFPSVAILGCSDSRVPIEIVFDQGLGDIFVIRVAGNCLDTVTTGSLEYAVHHLKVKCLIVMGHEGCGAIKAATMANQEIEKESADLSLMLKQIKHGLDEDRLKGIQDPRAHDREAVVTNVKVQVEQMSRNQGIMAKVRSGELLVVGAFYEISSGIVDFFHEISTDSNEGKKGNVAPAETRPTCKHP